MEPHKMTIEGTHGRYFREFYREIRDNFPEEEVDSLRKYIGMKGEAWWRDFLCKFHDEILNSLRAMPGILRTPLNYQKDGLLILASLIYIRRAVDFSGFVDAAAPALNQPHGTSLATLADIFDQMTYSETKPLWELADPNPFS